jgi:hypothetical protein
VSDHSDGPRSFRDPQSTTHPAHPVTDEVSAAILGDAVVQLTILRSPLSSGDALAELHATLSLLAELNASLPATVAAARDQDHTWHDIARQLEVTPATPAVATANTNVGHKRLRRDGNRPDHQTPAHPTRAIGPLLSRPPRLC